MFKRALWLSFLIHNAMTYHQSDYKIAFERVEILDYDKNYVPFAKTANFKYNRTTAATNFTLYMAADFDKKLQIAVQAYKFSSNEYRLFPLVFTVNICNTISQNDFGLQNLYSCGNLTGCPMKKGKYLICNWNPDESKFPPFIPPASYMFDIQVIYGTLDILHAQGYATVKRIADFAPRFKV